MKDNVVTIDWSDEILAKTVLTHAGEDKGAATDAAAQAAKPALPQAAPKPPKPIPQHAAA